MEPYTRFQDLGKNIQGEPVVIARRALDMEFIDFPYFLSFYNHVTYDSLTAGCAKYRYNKLPLGEINDIPRVLDAGQCNDSYSLGKDRFCTPRGVWTGRLERLAHRVQHRVVGTKSSDSAVGPPLAKGEKYPLGSHPAGVPLAQRGERAGQQLRDNRYHHGSRRYESAPSLLIVRKDKLFKDRPRYRPVFFDSITRRIISPKREKSGKTQINNHC